jgi:5-hydroxyisourate hydrolase
MISTHVLDLVSGKPAEGVSVELDRRENSAWKRIADSATSSDGRIQFQCPAEAGTYRLKFKIDDYFKKSKQSAFFVVAPVIFQITDTNRKYHIPLLLSSYGYSTYRGS